MYPHKSSYYRSQESYFNWRSLTLIKKTTDFNKQTLIDIHQLRNSDKRQPIINNDLHLINK